MNENVSSMPQEQSKGSRQSRSQWKIHPGLWNEEEAATASGEEDPAITGIALQEPNRREPDVVPMMLGSEDGPAQTLKPISVSLLHKTEGVVAKDESPADESANEDITRYLEERLNQK